ncbi:MAG: hypothetical protein KGY44_05720, partial [Halanaerobiales bacterium]|nr:hypothetical protein [Halanaerobiales bacterium]
KVFSINKLILKIPRKFGLSVVKKVIDEVKINLFVIKMLIIMPVSILPRELSDDSIQGNL